MLHLQTKRLLRQDVSWKAKKQVVISATFMSMTEKKKKDELEQVPCIKYFISFKE